MVAPSLSHTDAAAAAAGPTRYSANFIYFLSNLPVACSQVYKEKSFKADKVDVIYLTQWGTPGPRSFGWKFVCVCACVCFCVCVCVCVCVHVCVCEMQARHSLHFIEPKMTD